MKEYAYSLSTHFPNLHADIEVIKVNVRLVHVHMVFVVPSRIAVAQGVQFLKSQSGKLLKAKFAFLNKVFWGHSGIWSRGYCVLTV